jgi:hypothetical protein
MEIRDILSLKRKLVSYLSGFLSFFSFTNLQGIDLVVPTLPSPFRA